MYCVIGEKVLRCEVKKKEEMSSMCKVGSSKKEQVISNNRLFETEQAATQFIKNRKVNQKNESKLVISAVEKCTALYEQLYDETGIEVRTIDRQWTVSSAEKHITKLKRTLLDKPETHDKNVSKSFSIAPHSKKDDRKSNRRGTARGNSRGDLMSDSKLGSKGESKNDSRGKLKGDSKHYSKDSSRGDSRGSSRGESRNDSRGGSRGNARSSQNNGANNRGKFNSKTK